jgi:hypothetical protein
MKGAKKLECLSLAQDFPAKGNVTLHIGLFIIYEVSTTPEKYYSQHFIFFVT